MDQRIGMGAAVEQRMDSRIDLDRLPVRRVEPGLRVAGILMGVVGGSMVLGMTGVFFGEFTLWGLVTPFAWVGVAIFLFGVHLFIRRKEVTLDAERVSVRIRGVIGAKTWVEPLAAYRGVMIRSKWISGGQHNQSHQVFLVELQHEDPKKTIEVFESRRDKGWHATWRDISLRFRLPALEETPDGVVARLPEDLEKSVREKVREGALEIAFDPSAAPPAGLAVQAADGGLDIRVLQRNWRSPTLWTGVGMIVAGGILSSVLIAWEIPGMVTTLLLAGFGLAAVVHVAGFLVSKPRLFVASDGVTISVMTPVGERRNPTIDPERISGVEMGAPKGQPGGVCLHILTDDGRIFFGAGLSREALEWLRNCLLAAMARL
jgi:hypothetical protein